LNTTTSSHERPRRPRRAARGNPTRRIPKRTLSAGDGRFEAAAHDATPVAFDALALDERILAGVTDRGFARTTPIQSAVIPLIRAGGDLIGSAETGTGKTAAFLVPIIERFLARPSSGVTRALVLAPTRELAVQIEDEFQGLAYHTPLTVAAVYGGVAAGPQERALRAGVDLVVATPGRLLDHLAGGAGAFERLEVLVLDEADRMLDMGFWPDVRRIVAALPASRQTLFFSATMTDDVFRSAVQIMREPKLIEVGRAGGPAGTITHRAHRVAAGDKAAWLARFLRRTDTPSLVFVRTKREADRLVRRLAAAGVRSVALHADRTQTERRAAVEGFRSGRHRALVATDLAARGLDIEGIGHVINYDVPDSADAYVHRVGRTGRAEATGNALTLVASEEVVALRALERALDIRLNESDAAADSATP
jgi:ATP-dependent RNA helicase RhlE